MPLPALRRRLAAAVFLLAAIPYSKAGDAASAATFAAPTDLRVALVGPLDIVLEWKDRATHARGYVVEYKMQSDEEFMILGFVPSSAPRFRHENLAPGTRFAYRVRPFFGYLSPLAPIATGPASSVVVPDDEWTAPRRESRDAIGKQESIRDPLTAATAAATDLTATLVHGTGVRLAWRDRAGDEDGYLVEIKAASDPEFRVCALLEPDTISFGLAGLPEKTEFSFRVRAFFYGEPSNIGEKTTGAADSEPSRS